MTDHTSLRAAGTWARVTSLCASVLATVAVLGFLGWLAWTGANLREQMRVETERAIRITELRGTILGLNEQLATSARLAAMSGDTRWLIRYNEVGPALSSAIAEAVRLATPAVRAALRDTTDEAAVDLVRMERASIALGAAGDREGALALLDGPEFSYLQDSYNAGMEAFGQDLRALAADGTATMHDRAWTETLGLALSAVLVVAAALAVAARGRLRVASARAEAATRVDPLTGLPNRRQLKDRLREILSAASTGEVALLLLDLERFKLINDLHGYSAGDALLKLVAGRLRSVARDDDVLARLGGDEFAIVFRLDTDAGRTDQRAGPIALAQRVLAALQRSFELDGSTSLSVSARAGLVVTPAREGAADALLGHADVALRQARAERLALKVYDPAMEAAVRRRALLEADLRRALADDEIVPHFQPQFDLSRGSVVGYEILARWTRPTGERVSPVEFIPLVEELGLIGVMSQQLLRRACRATATWPSNILLAFNISPLQLRDPALPAIIRDVLHEAGMKPGRLEIEITESALVGDFDVARDVLQELKASGIRLALDDFGTGYSSLLHLQKLPFDTIKIDASFVGVMVDNAESRKIVGAVIGLARSLGRTTVAEGVEQPETADLLRSMGCDVGQGWLFGRPVPADEAVSLLDACVAREPIEA